MGLEVVNVWRILAAVFLIVIAGRWGVPMALLVLLGGLVNMDPQFRVKQTHRRMASRDTAHQPLANAALCRVDRA